ncbi:MAG: hypothetical protein Q4P08_02415 [Eubacteriales bacterium]|nr:hypothetical protein [Eubacteriales bacterium]
MLNKNARKNLAKKFTRFGQILLALTLALTIQLTAIPEASA